MSSGEWERVFFDGGIRSEEIAIEGEGARDVKRPLNDASWRTGYCRPRAGKMPAGLAALAQDFGRAGAPRQPLSALKRGGEMTKEAKLL